MVVSLKSVDFNRQAGLFLAGTYLALSVLEFALGRSLLYGSVSAFEFAAFLSGPIGFLLALASTPDSWTMTMLTYYLIGTLLLAPCLVFSCHRRTRVRGTSIAIGVLVWLATGFLAGTACLASRRSVRISRRSCYRQDSRSSSTAL
jgi:hypothetical protein